MKKKMIIFDGSGNFIKFASEMSDFEIACIVSDNIQRFDLQKIPTKVIPRSLNSQKDFYETFQNTYNLSYEQIELYRSTQLKVEHYLQRFISDEAMIQYCYLLALSFWLDFFDKNKIDVLFSSSMEHGGHYETIPYAIAKIRNIPVYNLFILSSSYKDKCYICCLMEYNTKNFIDLTELNIEKVNLEDYLSNKLHASILNIRKYRIFKTISYFFHTKIRPIPVLLVKIFRTPLQEYNFQSKISMSKISKLQLFFQSSYIKRLKKVYDKISSHVNLQENYIYFSLNLEPEANIMVRQTLTSQLYAIKMIADTLPKGWKLYVKEHPDQFFIYRETKSHLNHINVFRSMRFYSQIKLFKNVELVSLDINSKNLIKNSKIVATINGSVLLESIIQKKPIIIFGNNVNPIELSKDCFKIKNLKNLEDAFDKIQQGYIPTYDDVNQIFNKYSILIDNTRHYNHEKEILSLVMKKLS